MHFLELFVCLMPKNGRNEENFDLVKLDFRLDKQKNDAQAGQIFRRLKTESHHVDKQCYTLAFFEQAESCVQIQSGRFKLVLDDTDKTILRMKQFCPNNNLSLVACVDAQKAVANRWLIKVASPSQMGSSSR